MHCSKGVFGPNPSSLIPTFQTAPSEPSEVIPLPVLNEELRSLAQVLLILLQEAHLVDHNNEASREFLNFFWEEISSESVRDIEEFLNDEVILSYRKAGIEAKYRISDLLRMLCAEGLIDIHTLEMRGRDGIKRMGLDYFLKKIAPHLKLSYGVLRDYLETNLGKERLLRGREEFEEASDTDLCVQIKKGLRASLEKEEKEEGEASEDAGCPIPVIELKVIEFIRQRTRIMDEEKFKEALVRLKERFPRSKVYKNLQWDSAETLTLFVQKFLAKPATYYDGITACCLFEIGSLDLTIYDNLEKFSDFTKRSLRLNLAPFFLGGPARVMPYSGRPDSLQAVPDDPQVIVDILTDYIRTVDPAAIKPKDWINFLSLLSKGSRSNLKEHQRHLEKFAEASNLFGPLLKRTLKKHHKSPFALMGILWNARCSLGLIKERAGEKYSGLQQEISKALPEGFRGENAAQKIIEGYARKLIPFEASAALVNLFLYLQPDSEKESPYEIEKGIFLRRMLLNKQGASCYIHIEHSEKPWEALASMLCSLNDPLSRSFLLELLRAIFLSKRGSAAIPESEIIPLLKSEDSIVYMCGLYCLSTSASAPSQEASETALKHAFMFSDLHGERSILEELENLLQGAPYFLKPANLTGLQPKEEGEPQKMWALSLAGSGNLGVQRIAFLLFKEAAEEEKEIDPLTVEAGFLLLKSQGSVHIRADVLALLYKLRKITYQDALLHLDSICQTKGFVAPKSFEKLLGALVKECPQGKSKLPALKGNGAFIAKALAENDDIQLLQAFIKSPLMSLITDGDSQAALYERACLKNLSAESLNPLEALEFWLAALRKNLWSKTQKGRGCSARVALKLLPPLREHSPASLNLLLDPLAKIQIPKENQEELGRLVFECRVAMSPSNVHEVASDKFLNQEQKDELKLHMLEKVFAGDTQKALPMAVQIFRDELAPSLRLRAQAILSKIVEASCGRQVSSENLHLISSLLINKRTEALLEGSYPRMLLMLFQSQLKDAGELQGKRLELAALLMEKLKKLPLHPNEPFIAEASLALLALLDSYWLPETGRHASLKRQLAGLTPKMFAAFLASGEIMGAFKLMQKMAICKIPFERRECGGSFKELLLQGIASEVSAVQEQALEGLKTLYALEMFSFLEGKGQIEFIEALLESLVKLKKHSEIFFMLEEALKIDKNYFAAPESQELFYRMLAALRDEGSSEQLLNFYKDWTERKVSVDTEEWKNFWNALLHAYFKGKENDHVKSLLTVASREELDESSLEILSEVIKEAPLKVFSEADCLFVLSLLEKLILADDPQFLRVFQAALSNLEDFEHYGLSDRVCEIFTAHVDRMNPKDCQTISDASLNLARQPGLSLGQYFKMLGSITILNALAEAMKDLKEGQEDSYSIFLASVLMKWKAGSQSIVSIMPLFVLKAKSPHQDSTAKREVLQNEIGFLKVLAQEREYESCLKAVNFCCHLALYNREAAKDLEPVALLLIEKASRKPASNDIEEEIVRSQAKSLHEIYPSARILIELIFILSKHRSRKSYFEMQRCFLKLAGQAIDDKSEARLKRNQEGLKLVLARFMGSSSLVLQESMLVFLINPKISDVLTEKHCSPLLRKLIIKKIKKVFAEDYTLEDAAACAQLFINHFRRLQGDPKILKKCAVGSLFIISATDPLNKMDSPIWVQWQKAFFGYVRGEFQSKRVRKSSAAPQVEDLLDTVCEKSFSRLNISFSSGVYDKANVQLMLNFLNEALLLLFENAKKPLPQKSELLKSYWTVERILKERGWQVPYESLCVRLAELMLKPDFYTGYPIDCFALEHLMQSTHPEFRAKTRATLWRELRPDIKREVIVRTVSSLLDLNTAWGLQNAILYLRSKQDDVKLISLDAINGLYERIFLMLNAEHKCIPLIGMLDAYHQTPKLGSSFLIYYMRGLDLNFVQLSNSIFAIYKTFPLVSDKNAAADTYHKMYDIVSNYALALTHLSHIASAKDQRVLFFRRLSGLSVTVIKMGHFLKMESSKDLLNKIYGILEQQALDPALRLLPGQFVKDLHPCYFAGEETIAQLFEISKIVVFPGGGNPFEQIGPEDSLTMSRILTAIRDKDLDAFKSEKSAPGMVCNEMNILQIACLYSAENIVAWLAQEYPELIETTQPVESLMKLAKEFIVETQQILETNALSAQVLTNPSIELPDDEKYKGEEDPYRVIGRMLKSHPEALNQMTLSPLELSCFTGNVANINAILERMPQLGQITAATCLKLIIKIDDPDEKIIIAAMQAFQQKLGDLEFQTICEISEPNVGRILQELAMLGKFRTLKYLLELGADPNNQDQNGNTPLHVLCRKPHLDKDDLEMFQNLLDHSADSNVTNADGFTPLHMACARKHVSLLDELVQSVDQIVPDPLAANSSLFTLAATNGHVSVFRELIRILKEDYHYENRQVVEILNTQNAHGASPLSIAVEEGHQELVAYLLNAGADPLIRDKEVLNIVHRAAYKGLPRILDLVLNAVTCPVKCESDEEIVSSDGGCAGLLHLASISANLKTIKRLINLGVVLESQDTSGYTVFHICALKNLEKPLEIFVEAARRSNTHIQLINIADINGMTPLHHAAKLGFEGVVKTLLEQGAIKNAKDRRGKTALKYASEGGFQPVIKQLSK